MTEMEILCKLYLELANVVPLDCFSSREKVLQRHIDKYGIALMMIVNGAADPRKIAEDALNEYNRHAP